MYILYWMMQNILCGEGDTISVTYTKLPPCTFAKFQPQHEEFLAIADQRAVLNFTLRSFACLTEGDTIAINYNNKVYEIEVKELKPAKAVNIIECDMQVDFEAPPGYVEFDYKAMAAASSGSTSMAAGTPSGSVPIAMDGVRAGAASSPVASVSSSFSGAGVRLDGKAIKQHTSTPQGSSGMSASVQPTATDNVVAAPFQLGKLTFQRGFTHDLFLQETIAADKAAAEVNASFAGKEFKLKQG
jgi:ubiquitin fusion degradation protein 1